MDSIPKWDWSSVGNSHDPDSPPATSPAHGQTEKPGTTQEESSQSMPSSNTRAGASTPQYGPRTCRICLDTVQPAYPTNISSTFGISSTSSKPQYISDDPELGRLLSPCKCKGTQKYVHEGCLNAWRLSNPSANRNFWQCPTCKYSYRMTRLRWASMLSSKFVRGVLTLLILFISLFILGFIADPLVDLWFDPLGTIGDTVSNVVSDLEATRPSPYEEPMSWAEHFMKGFFSLGVIGLAKSMFALGPWHYINFRGFGGFGGGRRRGTGRARAENISLAFVAIGLFTFLMATWKVVRSLSGRVLAHVSEKILDIDEDGEPDEGVAT